MLPAFAANNGADNQTGQQNQKQIQQQSQSSASETGNQVQNQNQAADFQFQENAKEKINLESGQTENLQNRNQNVVLNMNQVTKHIQQLLQIRTTDGIGEQIRQIAKAQNQTQIQIQEQLNKLESKGKLARLVTGTDYKAVGNLKQQFEQNRLRIEQLRQLQNQFSNESDVALIELTIRAMTEENTSLKERITAEEQTRSMLGWLFQLFA